MKATVRRARNKIRGLFGDDGLWHNSDSGIEAVVLNHFEVIYKSSLPSPIIIEEVLASVSPKLSSPISNFLDSDFTIDEIRSAVFGLGALKAPGKDGLPAVFFQKFWDKVGPSVTAACLDCLNKGGSLEQLNETLVVLIPKKDVSERISDFRPISLCNVIYKIVAKTVANRFRHALDGVISEVQSAFIPGRLISDNVLISFECLHRLKRRKRKQGSMAVKLDMSKAFDRVEWAFIEGMMRKLGFSSRWISLILRCISSVSYSFVINGSVCGLLKPTRGLRQGDPLSPYLFLLCSEGFSCLINQAVSTGVIQGFNCIRNGPIISHLLFADDCILFAQASTSNCAAFKCILQLYASASGQLVNYDKSAICFSPSISSIVCVQLAAILGVRTVSCHEYYLGLPCFTGRKKKELFAAISSRIWDKIKGWRDKFLSTGGKEILIKAVLQSIPIYSMNLFRLPKGIFNEVYRLCARFWWGSNESSRKIHWCTWSRLCDSKVRGGLGFRNLEVHNQALLANQCWRIMANSNSLVARVLKASYFPDSDFLDADCGSSASYIWKSLMWGKEIVVAGTRWRVGDGKSIHIYKDRWIPRPSTFKPFSPPFLGDNATVDQLLSASGGWNIDLIKRAFCEEDISAILSIPISHCSVKDSLQWHFEHNGTYSSKSGYQLGMAINSEIGPSFSGTFSCLFVSWWKSLWKLRLPSKIKFFLWRACNNFLPTNEVLERRKIPVCRLCPFCKRKSESILHCLWSCSKLKEVRHFWFNTLPDFHCGNVSFFDFILRCYSSLSETELGLLCVCLWKIWAMRNDEVHNSSSSTVSDVVSWAQGYIAEFHSACAPLVLPPALSVDSNPIWIPPDPGVYKFNCDAALNQASCLVGFGIVVRNCEGLVMASSSQSITATFSPQIAEAEAIRRSLQLARDTGLVPCTIVSDAQVVVGWINDGKILHSDIGVVITDIQNLLVQGFCVSISFSPRSANRIAHVLAKNGLSCLEDMFWLEEFPPCVGSLVAAESLSCL